jgi:hypothetical protein
MLKRKSSFSMVNRTSSFRVLKRPSSWLSRLGLIKRKPTAVVAKSKSKRSRRQPAAALSMGISFV